MTNREPRKPWRTQTITPAELVGKESTGLAVSFGVDSNGDAAPGIIVACGTFTGYRLGTALDAPVNSAQIGFAAMFANESPLVIYPDSPAGKLDLCLFRIDACGSWFDAKHDAQEWAGRDNPGTVASPDNGVATVTGFVAPKNYDGAAYDTALIPVSATSNRPIFLQADLDTTTPPGVNDPAAVYCAASTQAKSRAGNGYLFVPGGTVNWPGGPCYVTEIANVANANPGKVIYAQ